MSVNRTDLVAAARPPVYGERKRQQAGARALQSAAPPSAPSVAAPPAPPGPVPGGRGPLDRPTERPGEPITAGAPFGAGPGPEALRPFPTAPSPDDDALAKLRVLYQLYPNANLGALLREAERLAASRRGVT